MYYYEMQALIRPEVKPKIASFCYLTYSVKKKSVHSKYGLDFKFYQKLLIIILTSCAFLIFPESPKDAEVLCNKFHSKQACVVW